MLHARNAFWMTMALALVPELVTTAKAATGSDPAITAAAADVTQATAPTMPLSAAPDAAPMIPAVPAATVTAKPAAPLKPAVTLAAKVDLTRQTLTVTERGKLVGIWKISSGVSEEFATPRGTFKPEWTAKLWHSIKYDNAPMPHAVFFKGGAAIHATQAVGRLGTPASHGCVRLAPANAATFYGLVQRHGLAHTQIQVYGDAPYPRAMAKAGSTKSSSSKGTRDVGATVPASANKYAWPRQANASSSWFSSSGNMRWPTNTARARY